MIIDFHTHTFPDKIAQRAIGDLSRKADIRPHCDGTADGLRRSMEEAGIDLSVVLPVATAARQVEHINDSAARQNEAMEGKGLFSFGCMHPEYEGYHDELARIAALGLKGIKIHPVYQGVDIDDLRFLRILDRAAQLGLLVVTHAGDDIGFPGEVRCSPRMCRCALEEVGDFPLILAHMGGWRNWEEVPEYLAQTGVYLDTAFSGGAFDPIPGGRWKEGENRLMGPEAFTRLVRAFGAERVLFGTDSPWSGQKESLAWFDALDLSGQEKELILGENARRLLGV